MTTLVGCMLLLIQLHVVVDQWTFAVDTIFQISLYLPVSSTEAERIVGEAYDVASYSNFLDV